MQPSPCTSCGKMNDAATFVGQEKHQPSPNDIAICIYCSHVMVYDEQLRLRELTDKEVVEVASNPRLVAAMKIIEKINKKKTRSH